MEKNSKKSVEKMALQKISHVLRDVLREKGRIRTMAENIAEKAKEPLK